VNKHILKAQRKEGLKWMMYFSRRSFRAMAGMNTFFNNKDTLVPYPLLIITGEHDLQLAQEAAEEMHELEQHSERVIIPGAGHCANVDTPHAFNKAVEGFLEGRAIL
jgi:3-oxoadipate enol-lactonase